MIRQRCGDVDKKPESITKKFYRAVKNEAECINCGFDSPKLLEFHHRVPSLKTATISSLARKGNVQRLFEEAAKCDILCRGCHDDVHYMWDRGLRPTPVEDTIKHLRRSFDSVRKLELPSCIYSPKIHIPEPKVGIILSGQHRHL